MPLTQPYYLNGPSLASATAVFLDAAMTTCAPDGFYSDGLIVRQLSGCVLLPGQTCQDCCPDPCWGFNVELIGVGDIAEIGRFDCYEEQYVIETITGPYNQDFCVLYGTPIDVISGVQPTITQTFECGCCACTRFLVTPVPAFSSVTIEYKDCEGVIQTDTIATPQSYFVFQATYIQIILGNATITRVSCFEP